MAKKRGTYSIHFQRICVHKEEVLDLVQVDERKVYKLVSKDKNGIWTCIYFSGCGMVSDIMCYQKCKYLVNG